MLLKLVISGNPQAICLCEIKNNLNIYSIVNHIFTSYTIGDFIMSPNNSSLKEFMN